MLPWFPGIKTTVEQHLKGQAHEMDKVFDGLAKA
jgi:hypothetical protein